MMGVNSDYCRTCRNDGCFFYDTARAIFFAWRRSRAEGAEADVGISIYEEDNISEKNEGIEKNSNRAAWCEKQKPDQQDPVQEAAAPYLCLLQEPEHCRKISGWCGGRRIYLRGWRDAHKKGIQWYLFSACWPHHILYRINRTYGIQKHRRKYSEDRLWKIYCGSEGFSIFPERKKWIFPEMNRREETPMNSRWTMDIPYSETPLSGQLLLQDCCLHSAFIIRIYTTRITLQMTWLNRLDHP